MTFYDIGYSNIRLSNEDNNYAYIYDSRINQFPEEVYVHEFLHTLERISTENGYDVPNLHDNLSYGYDEENLVGLKNWYKDYMQCSIKNQQNETVGINPNVYLLKPVHESNFTSAEEVEFYEETDNIIDEIREIYKKIVNIISRKEE